MSLTIGKVNVPYPEKGFCLLPYDMNVSYPEKGEVILRIKIPDAAARFHTELMEETRILNCC